MTTWTLYKHTAVDGEVLYIGCTSNLAKRTADHAHRSPWWPEVATVATSALLLNRQAALDCERALIHVLQPRHNELGTVHIPTRRPVKLRSSGTAPTGERSDAAVWVLLRTGRRQHAIQNREHTLCGLTLDWRCLVLAGAGCDEPRCVSCDAALLAGASA